MSELIEVVQLHDVGGGLVRLFEISLNGSTLYFHPGVDENLTDITFDGNTYVAFPIEITGMEVNADGALNRPELTVANVLNVFSSALGNLKNKDLIGERVTVRTTLTQHLASNPAIEFPVKKYIIDRISGENPTAVTFELAAPFDLTGIEVPNRSIVGKYCSWIYQGAEDGIGGCMWRKNSTIEVNGSSFSPYFTIDDKPIIPSPETLSGTLGTDYFQYTTYSGGTTYSPGNYVLYNNTIWKCIAASTNNTPSSSSLYWTRGDVCGKKLSSCKARFQFIPNVDGNPTPNEFNTTKSLPFGAFPGSRKFR